MKKVIYLILFTALFSCGNKKVVQLPEINNAKITDVLDVSTVYMFYNKATDSIEFNRKNMISTTNWLVNVDKRLTLKQMLPHLQYLQDKRHGEGMHKNENAKNYFTCHDKSVNNLGFLEFTDILYYSENDLSKFLTSGDKNILQVYFKNIDDISILRLDKNEKIVYDSFLDFTENLSLYQNYQVHLGFDKNISFQDYITIKSNLSKMDTENLTLSNQEFIY